MKKVIFFISSLSGGGAERAVSNISSNLSEEIKQTILIYGSLSKVEYPHSARIEYLDKATIKGSFTKTKVYIKRIIKFNRILKKFKDTTVISFLQFPNIINAISSKRTTKNIISVRNFMSLQNEKGFKAVLKNLAIKKLYNRVDQIVAPSEEIKKDLINNYNIKREKITVIYNSYPINHIKKISEQKLEDKYVEIFKSPVIITVGRLSEQKGHWHLIRAFKKMKSTIPDLKLVLLGNGELEEYLKDLALKLNVHEDVFFLGFQDNPFKFISKSKLFVLSSFYEGFPNVLAEAMACGVPVASSDCLSGPREILAPDEIHNEEINYEISLSRYGILLPVYDGIKHEYSVPLTNEELCTANTLIELLQNKTLLNVYSNKSIERIKDFDINKIISEWEKIL